MSQIHIKQGQIIDPANNINRIGDVYIADGKVVSVTHEPAGFKPTTVIDATNKIICPGFIDLSTRLREPGRFDPQLYLFSYYQSQNLDKYRHCILLLKDLA